MKAIRVYPTERGAREAFNAFLSYLHEKGIDSVAYRLEMAVQLDKGVIRFHSAERSEYMQGSSADIVYYDESVPETIMNSVLSPIPAKFIKIRS